MIKTIQGSFFFGLVALCFVGSSAFALTDPAEKYPSLDLYLEKEGLVRTQPTWFKPKNITLAPRDISYWKKILPYEEDRYADMYMVIPQLGLISPIQQISRDSADWSHMLDGREIGINKYLQGGIIEYAGSVAPGHEGKRIDFGHSNYLSKDAGRYKTIFATLMWLDPGDEVWYFVRNGDLYTLHRYRVSSSYPTKPSNVAALSRDGDGADALIFGCYHGLDGRWMIEAEYIGTPVAQSVVNEPDEFVNLSSYWRSRIDAGLSTLQRIPLKWRRQHIAYLITRITSYKNTYSLSENEQTVLEYMLVGLSELYQ